MANYTLRLPADLKALAEEEAKAHGRDLSEELRLALASYYERPWGLVSNKDLAEKIREHEERFHMSLAGKTDTLDLRGEASSLFQPGELVSAKAPPGKDVQVVSVVQSAEWSGEPPVKAVADDSEIIHGASGFDFPRSEALLYLRGLKEMLHDGQTPTPTDLGAYFHQPSRRIGRVLNQFGIKARNTRVGGVSSRFFLPAMLGQVEKELEKLGEKGVKDNE